MEQSSENFTSKYFEIITRSNKIITDGKKLPLSENYKLSEVEQSVIISFSDFSENYGDNFSDNSSKSFDIFSLKLSPKKVYYDVTKQCYVLQHPVRTKNHCYKSLHKITLDNKICLRNVFYHKTLMLFYVFWGTDFENIENFVVSMVLSNVRSNFGFGAEFFKIRTFGKLRLRPNFLHKIR